MTTLPRPFGPDAQPALPNAGRTGLIVFMAVATTLFSLLLLAYGMRMREPTGNRFRIRRCCGGTPVRWCWPASRCSAPDG